MTTQTIGYTQFSDFETHLTQLSEQLDTLSRSATPADVISDSFRTIDSELIQNLSYLDQSECQFSDDEKVKALRVFESKLPLLKKIAIGLNPDEKQAIETINNSRELALKLRLEVLTGSGTPPTTVLPFPETLLLEVNSSQSSESGGSATDRISKLFWFAMGVAVGGIVGGLGAYAYQRYYTKV